MPLVRGYRPDSKSAREKCTKLTRDAEAAVARADAICNKAFPTPPQAEPNDDRWRAGVEAALEAIQARRHLGAVTFNDPRYAGQRGVDHGDALFDAYRDVKKLLTSPQETVLAAELKRDQPALYGRTDGVPFGIIDPDYARVWTIGRCIAWSEGYALVAHGSFTRDLDLLAVPWTEQATDAEHLVKRIALALDDLDILVKDPKSVSQATQKPHGRLAWTFTFKAFGDPRFVDLSVTPRRSRGESS